MKANRRITEWGGIAQVMRAVPFIFCLPTIVLLMSIVSPAALSAQEVVRLDIMGSAGGNHFEYICTPGRVLVGVRGYTGVWIDNVQAVCAKVGANGVSDPRPEGPVFGSNRAANNDYHCSSGLVAAGMYVENNRDNPYLGLVRPLCADFFTRRILDLVTAAPRGMMGTGRLLYPAVQNCPANLVAVGIRGRASQFVDALAITCGSPELRAQPAAPGINDYLGKEVSVQSMNFPDRYIRHRNWLGYIEPPTNDLGRKDATFKIVPGLADRCVSFESHNLPNHFLRHEGYRLKLALRQNEPLFREDATFCVVTGLADPNGVSFESVNNPGHFIRHRNLELWLDRQDGNEFSKDATFRVKSPAFATAQRTFGRIKTTQAGRETPRPPAALTPPFITAAPAEVIVAAGQSQGQTTLTWDGGATHAYAEVWVKVGDGSETFIVEQGKGQREVTVERGKSYLFILTDAGERLATISVTVR